MLSFLAKPKGMEIVGMSGVLATAKQDGSPGWSSLRNRKARPAATRASGRGVDGIEDFEAAGEDGDRKKLRDKSPCKVSKSVTKGNNFRA